MKKGIHPQMGLVLFRCASCNGQRITTSTKLDAKREEYQGVEYPTVVLETCSSCHPFYTQKQTYIDTAGRVEKYKQRFGKFIDEAEAKERKTKPKEEAAAEQSAERQS